MIAKSVHVKKPGRGKQKGEHVGQSHHHENEVGRRSHVSLRQNDDYQGVGYDGDDEKKRHYVSVQRLGEPENRQELYY